MPPWLDRCAVTGSPVFGLGHAVLGRLHPSVAALARRTVVYGEMDPIPDRDLLRETSSMHPGMTVAVVPGADHHVLLTRIDASLDLIRSSMAALPLLPSA